MKRTTELKRSFDRLDASLENLNIALDRAIRNERRAAIMVTGILVGLIICAIVI